MDSDDVSVTAIAKLLASCRKSTRDRALRLLKTLLSCPKISDDELLRIWKGLFYCVWHADKIPVQTDLIDRLSSLMVSLDFPLAPRYFHTFLATVRREWSGIDHQRLDKFYLLIRRFVNKFFLLLRSHDWDAESVGLMVGVLAERSILLVDNKFPAQGVNYHISQVFLDEIREFLPLSEGTMVSLLTPFFRVMETSLDKVFVKKVKDNVFARLLESGLNCFNGLKKNECDRAVEEDEKLGKVVLCMGFPKMFFTSASAPGTVQSNRKVLFELHNQFLKLENDLKSSCIHVSLEINDAMNIDAKSSKKKEPKKSKKKKIENTCVSTTDEITKCTSASTTTKESLISVEPEEVAMTDLQKQFETIAVDAGMVSSIDGKKKKRSKSDAVDGMDVCSFDNNGNEDEKSCKKVRFAAKKNNLFWKPQTPLPPETLRLPPSSTPRGSALKKGIPPGPVNERLRLLTPSSECSKKVKVKHNSIKKKVKHLRKFKGGGVGSA